MLSLDLITSHSKNYGFSMRKFGSEIRKRICSFCIVSIQRVQTYTQSTMHSLVTRAAVQQKLIYHSARSGSV